MEQCLLHRWCQFNQCDALIYNVGAVPRVLMFLTDALRLKDETGAFFCS